VAGWLFRGFQHESAHACHKRGVAADPPDDPDLGGSRPSARREARDARVAHARGSLGPRWNAQHRVTVIQSNTAEVLIRLSHEQQSGRDQGCACEANDN
jgi:hypothetical protein